MNAEAQGFIARTLQKMISIDSRNPPGAEKVLAEYLRGILVEHGIESQVQDLGSRRANLVASISGARSGPVLILNGHLDTVPAEGAWEHDPFVGIVEGGKIYGLGAADMKGAISAMIATMLRIRKDFAHKMKGKVLLVRVADEERRNFGSKSFLKTPPEVDYAVIGEPTNMDLAVSNRGVLRVVITTSGKAAHCSNPGAGVNAIYKMQKVVAALEEDALRISAGESEYYAKPSLAVTLIKGGTGENIIPDTCEITIDRRVTSEESIDGVERGINDILKTLRVEDHELEYSVRRTEQLAGWAAKHNSALLQLSKKVYRRCLLRDPVMRDLGGTSEAGLFAAAGIDTLLCGPGDIRVAHSRYESVPLPQLEEAAAFYYELAQEILS